MFSFFSSKSIPSIDLSAIGTDMHSHLLPGIDDGSPDAGTSLELLKGLQGLGLKKFITTPHILWDLYRNDDQTIGNARAVFQQAADQQNIPLPVTAAAEYMMDDHFAELLRKKVPLRTISGKYVLVEFSFVSLPFEWKEMLFDLQMQGYQPVLAHPERYSYLGTKTDVFQEITEMGVVLQVNLNSLTGYYGKPALQLAKELARKKLVTFVGTDLHHHRHLEALRNSPHLMDSIKGLLDSGKLLNSQLEV
ncbi:tyrosine-protein phosphatase [Flavihumibacter fluvii]|uniref:tyrosine-protein phosphatase n=1 Tax=Flavihumibacter fluvii TaxID=2838157 RepID=UPI001BDEB8FD|nr:CpsB/CapC family capsule biosynthesis tyrosine phosphatase [Flavihumibacter fluvii]ULQ52410.1 histidinol phosphatase [Flavihumibacter fluvii]